MTLTFAPGTDFEDVVDGLEAVTLERRGGSDTSISHALQRAVSTSEVEASDGKYLSGDVRWHFPVAECASRPTPGDNALDAGGDRWTVLDVQEATLSRRWRCVCRNLTVAFGLNDTVRIDKATYSKDTGGAATETWSVWRAGVRAKIQPVSATVEADAGARRTDRQYVVFLGEDYGLDHQHRIVASDGTQYRVKGYTASEEIGQLQRADVVKERT